MGALGRIREGMKGFGRIREGLRGLERVLKQKGLKGLEWVWKGLKKHVKT